MSDATQDSPSGPPPIRTAFTLSCLVPQAHVVLLAGTFNNWKPAAMQREESGRWSATVALLPGHHEYKFVVDGQWCCEPGCEHEYHGCPKCQANAFGTMNRILEAPAT